MVAKTAELVIHLVGFLTKTASSLPWFSHSSVRCIPPPPHLHISPVTITTPGCSAKSCIIGNSHEVAVAGCSCKKNFPLEIWSLNKSEPKTQEERYHLHIFPFMGMTLMLLINFCIAKNTVQGGALMTIIGSCLCSIGASEEVHEHISIYQKGSLGRGRSADPKNGSEGCCQYKMYSWQRIPGGRNFISPR